MISFTHINQHYGKQLLCRRDVRRIDASFQLNHGEKVGLVVSQWVCKTTRFRMMVGDEPPDDGAASVPKEFDGRLFSLGRRRNAIPFDPG